MLIKPQLTSIRSAEKEASRGWPQSGHTVERLVTSSKNDKVKISRLGLRGAALSQHVQGLNLMPSAEGKKKDSEEGIPSPLILIQKHACLLCDQRSSLLAKDGQTRETFTPRAARAASSGQAARLTVNGGDSWASASLLSWIADSSVCR